MAFEQAETINPASIGNMRVVLEDVITGEDAPRQSAAFSLVVWYNDNTKKIVSGNLVPHITPAQRQGLIDFMNSLRVQAETEILP